VGNFEQEGRTGFPPARSRIFIRNLTIESQQAESQIANFKFRIWTEFMAKVREKVKTKQAEACSTGDTPQIKR
jgi:hypothetical protein